MVAAALLVLGAYLCGSIPVGVLVGRLFGFDPRTVGSRNIGMTNVARAGGTVAAALTFVGDGLKGLVPVLVGRRLNFAPDLLAVVAFAAFIGAIASVFLRFRGGRGVATSLGIWLGLAPVPILIALAVFIPVIAISRIVSLASLSAAVALPPVVAIYGCPTTYVLLATVMAAVVVLRHTANIGRLARGEEPRLGQTRQKRTD